MITLKIVFTMNPKKLPSDAVGYYEGSPLAKKITVLKTKEHRDTLIHELTHFLLDVTNRGGYTHRKKHKQIHKFLKKALA